MMAMIFARVCASAVIVAMGAILAGIAANTSVRNSLIYRKLATANRWHTPCFNPFAHFSKENSIMTLPTRVSRGLAVADPFDAVQREFDTALLGSTLGRFFGGRDVPQHNGGWAPYAVDVREDQDHLYVEAELPGFNKDEIEITLENQTLTISAEHKEGTKQDGDRGGDKGSEWLLRERRYSRFLRSFTLPQTIDDQKVDAKYSDGLLRITLNKREESKPRKITVG
jgi:HSP20 family protein